MTESISVAAAQQNYAIVMQLMALTQQKQSADISMQLIQGAVSGASGGHIGGAPQDPSTVTAEQVQSPVDIRV